MAHPAYGIGSLLSREVLISTPANSSNEVQLWINPMQLDLEADIAFILQMNRLLRGESQEIETEAKSENGIISQLQMTIVKAQAAVENNMRRMCKWIIQQGSNHVVHVILFVLVCFFVVYLLSKFFKR